MKTKRVKEPLSAKNKKKLLYAADRARERVSKQNRRLAVSSSRWLEELKAAYRHTESLLQRNDGISSDGFPLWHGWALTQAFRKGIEWERSHSYNK